MKSLALFTLSVLLVLQATASQLPNESLVTENTTPDATNLEEHSNQKSDDQRESAEDQERRWYREAVEARREKEQRKQLKKRIKKVMKLEYKANKVERAWNEEYKDFQGDPLEQCNTTCTKQCFTNETYNTWSPKQTVIQCVIGHCNCFTVEPTESAQSLFTEELASLFSADEEADEQLVVPESKLDEEESRTGEPYDLVKECDYKCGKQCLKLSSIVPFPVTTQCIEEKCRCRFSEAEALDSVQALLDQKAETGSRSRVGSLLIRLLMFLVVAGAFVYLYQNVPKCRDSEEAEEDEERKAEFLRRQGYQQL